MADLATEPRWGRIVGTFGEDADLSAEMTAAHIRGFQGEGRLSPKNVITMTKHSPAAGLNSTASIRTTILVKSRCTPATTSTTT